MVQADHADARANTAREVKRGSHQGEDGDRTTGIGRNVMRKLGIQVVPIAPSRKSSSAGLPSPIYPSPLSMSSYTPSQDSGSESPTSKPINIPRKVPSGYFYVEASASASTSISHLGSSTSSSGSFIPLDEPLRPGMQARVYGSPSPSSSFDPYSSTRTSPIQQRRRTSISSHLSSSHSSFSTNSPSSRSFVRSWSVGGLTASPGSVSSFVGSYENSLLSGRMSAVPPSQPLPFQIDIGVIGNGVVPKGLKCPPHLNSDFGAHFYNTEDGNGTPYVGTIDIEQHYFDIVMRQSEFQADGEKNLKNISFPGYQIPPKGQLQLIVKNPNRTPVKVFLVPYDLTSMPAGSKTFLRQKCYVSPSTSGSPPATPRKEDDTSRKESLRYAVHLNFCSPPQRGTKSVGSTPAKQKKSTLDQATSGRDALNVLEPKRQRTDVVKRTRSPKIYLYRTIRVVFASRTPDSNERLRTITETPDGVMDSKVADSWSFSRYNGPGEAWEELVSGVELGLPRRSSGIGLSSGDNLQSSQALRRAMEDSILEQNVESRSETTAIQWSEEDAALDPNGESFDLLPPAILYSSKEPLLNIPSSHLISPPSGSSNLSQSLLTPRISASSLSISPKLSSLPLPPLSSIPVTSETLTASQILARRASSPPPSHNSFSHRASSPPPSMSPAQTLFRVASPTFDSGSSVSRPGSRLSGRDTPTSPKNAEASLRSILDATPVVSVDRESG